MLALILDFNKLLQAAIHANYGYILLGSINTLVWLLLRALIWRTLLQDRPTFTDTFFTINAGYLLNNLLPLRLGELGRAYLISQKTSAKTGQPLEFWQAMSAVIIERVLDLAAGLSLLLLLLPFVVGGAWALPAALATGAVVLIGLIVLFALATSPEWALGQFERWGQRWPFLWRVGGGILPSFLKGLSVMRDARRFSLAVGLVVVNWGCGILQYFLFQRAFFPESQWLWAAFTLGVVTLGVAAPSSPGNVGPLELAMIGGLMPFTSDKDAAGMFAIAVHVNQYLITCALGAYALARDGQSLAGLYRRVRSLLETKSRP